MTLDTPLLPVSGAVFVLVLVRIGTMLMLVPGFSGRGVPTPLKIGFSVLLAVVLLPFVRVNPVGLEVADRFVVAVAQEFLVGLLMGFAVAVVFGAIEMAASLASLQMGLNLAAVFNPALNAQASALDTFYLVLASLIFFGVNGHHMLLVALQRSFESVPVGSATLAANGDQAIVALTAAMFVEALRIALPISGTLLVADAALGILNRMVPQMNVFFVGLPIKIVVGFLVLALTLPFLIRVLDGMMTRGLVDALGRAGAVVR